MLFKQFYDQIEAKLTKDYFDKWYTVVHFYLWGDSLKLILMIRLYTFHMELFLSSFHFHKPILLSCLRFGIKSASFSQFQFFVKLYIIDWMNCWSKKKNWKWIFFCCIISWKTCLVVCWVFLLEVEVIDKHVKLYNERLNQNEPVWL